MIQPGVGTIPVAVALTTFPNTGNHSLTIQGGGAFVLINFQSAGVLTVDRLTLSGANGALGGALQVATGGSVIVTNSALANNSGGSVSVTNSTFTGNSGGFSGGAIFSTAGDVSAASSTFTGNTGWRARSGLVEAGPSGCSAR